MREDHPRRQAVAAEQESADELELRVVLRGQVAKAAGPRWASRREASPATGR